MADMQKIKATSPNLKIFAGYRNTDSFIVKISKILHVKESYVSKLFTATLVIGIVN